MNLSVMSYTLARRRDLFSVQRLFEFSRELGLDAVDLVSLYDCEPTELRHMADDHEVHIVAHTFHADLAGETEAERRKGVDQGRWGLDAAAVLGAPVVMIPPKPAEGVKRETQRARWIAGLKELAPHAADAGIALTVENFPGWNSPFVVADDVLAAVREVPGLRHTYDNGNAATGEDPVESFRRCAGHVVHCHFKDWDVSETPREGFRQMLDGRYYRPALIGEGIVDHAGCIAAMAEAGYDGFINIEYEGNVYTPEEGTRRAADYMRGLLDQHR